MSNTAPRHLKKPADTAEIRLPLGLEQQLSHKMFPNRSMLMIQEVARALRVSDRHIVSLIEEGLLGAVEVTGSGNKSSAIHWRIPVAAYDDYIRRRSSTSETQQK